MTTVPGLWLSASVPGVDGDANDAPLSMTLLVLALQTPVWLQFDDECAHLYYLNGDVYRVDLVVAFAESSVSKARTTVVTVGAVVTFALVGTANASRTSAVLFSTDEAGYSFYYWQNVTATVGTAAAAPAIVYTGYQASVMQWMTCGNATVSTATLATPLATAVEGATVCPANGLAVQWQFLGQYVYPAALMQRFMVRSSVETYCATPTQRQTLYASLCRTASDQPPFLCSRTVPASMLTVLSVGFANAGFAYEALTLLLGVLLPWIMRCWQQQQQRRRQATAETLATPMAEAVEEGDAEAPSVAAVEMTAMPTEMKAATLTSVVNPLLHPLPPQSSPVS